MSDELLTLERITRHIMVLRGQKVLLDANLAALYGVEPRRLNEQVKRNLARFPADFMFQLSEDEHTALRSQFATLKTGRGQHRKYLPYAFTEHGAIMAAMFLNSIRATEVSVHVVRAFIQLRELAQSNKDMALRLNKLENRTDLMSLKQETFERHARVQLKQIIEALRELTTAPPTPAHRPIGFITPDDPPSKSRAVKKS